MADNWKTTEFRQTVMNRIRENMQSLPVDKRVNLADIENHIFNKAKSREEYMTLVGKVLVYAKNRAANTSNTADPIGQLQSLANQGTSQMQGMQIPGHQQNMGQVGPSGIQNNLLQNINQRPVQSMNAQAMHNKVPGMNAMQNQQMLVNQMGQMQTTQANTMMVNRNQLNQVSAPQQMGQQQHQNVQQQMAVPQMGSQQLLMGQQQQQQQMSQQMSQQQMSQQQMNQQKPMAQQMSQQQQIAQQLAQQQHLVQQQQMAQQQQLAQQQQQQQIAQQRQLAQKQQMVQQQQLAQQQQMAQQQQIAQQQHIAQQQQMAQQQQVAQQQMGAPQMGAQQMGAQQMGAQPLRIGQQQMPGIQLRQPQQQMTRPPMGTNQIQQALQNQMLSQKNMQNQLQNQVNHQMTSSMNPGMQSQPPRPLLQQQPHINLLSVNQMAQQQQQHQQQQQQQQQLGLGSIKLDFMTPTCQGGQRNLTPSKYIQSPSPSLPSPNSLMAPGSNQMVTSPAMVLSPNPQHTSHVGQRNLAMIPSPSSTSLNTPGGMIGGAAPSPIPDDQMSQACREKIQKLRKYIEPLHMMILKLTSEGYTEKMSKMKKLLEILTNPGPGTKLEVLEKCEVVLEKMDFRKFEAAATIPAPSFIKENQFSTPLLEVVSALLHNPTANNTLHRTFGPCVQSFTPQFMSMPPPAKKRKLEESSNEISDILQGEIARLDQRFKVSLDPTYPNGTRSTQLVCWLDDKYLPCVPPILVTVPEEYPSLPPKCEVLEHEYATPYLIEVKNTLSTRLGKLPPKFSLSQLLDSWEMSIRQAAKPKIEETESEDSTVTSTTVLTDSASASNEEEVHYHVTAPAGLENNPLIRELLS